MEHCINANNREFKALAEMSGLHPEILAAKMGVWMDKNNSEEWPTLSQIGINVEGKISVVDLENSKIYKPSVINIIKNKVSNTKINLSDFLNNLELSTINKSIIAELKTKLNQSISVQLLPSNILSERFKEYNEKDVAFYDPKSNTIFNFIFAKGSIY